MQHPFEDIVEGQLESLNFLQAQYVDDTCPQKVDLMCGVYRTDEGEPFVLPSVKKARRLMCENPSWNHEYPPSHLGTPAFRTESVKLFFGDDHPLLQSNQIVAAQVLGGSGANHMGALFLKLHYGPWKAALPTVYIPAESWANHPNVFAFLGVTAAPLPYYDASTRALGFEAFCSAISALRPRSVIVLQTCAQSPTGCDPTPSQWQALAVLFASNGHFAFFDAAYPGFVSGSPYADVECVRVFADAGVPLLVAATYGKAFGLYGERVGVLMISSPGDTVSTRIEKQMKLLARAETGAMPAFGATIVETILQDGALRTVWEQDVRHIATQLGDRRVRLRRRLEELGTPGSWTFITDQTGMFSYMGFTIAQIDQLRELHHVYLQDTGRVSIASLSVANVDYVARSIDAVVRQTTYQGQLTNGHAERP